jgi:amino acid transporter
VNRINTTAESQRTSPRLRANALGVGAITFFVISAAGPLVAMAGGVPVAMLLGNGAGVPAMFLVAVAILLPFAAGFTAMAHYVKNAGGFYAFAARGLGGYAAGTTATIAIFSYTAIQVGLYGLFGAAASELISAMVGLRLAWWLYSFLAMTVIGTLGYRQVDLSAKVLAVLVVGEYLVVLIFDCAVLRSPGSEISLAPFSPTAIVSGSPWLGLLMCFTAFIGFEATTIYAEEAREPERTIPIATYVSLLLIGAFYVFSSWCMVGAVGHNSVLPVLTALQDPTTFLFQLSDHYVGAWLTLLMRLLFLTSIFAAMLAFHNSIARYLFALGREALLPDRLARTHRRHTSPYVASCWQSVSAALLVILFVLGGADPVAVLFARISAVGTLGIIALMGIASAAVYMFFRTHPGNVWRVRLFPLASTLGLAMVLVLGCANFGALAGGSSPMVLWLPVTLLAAAGAGWVMADRLRRRDLTGFRELGSISL